jgi:hypothetical protein
MSGTKNQIFFSSCGNVFLTLVEQFKIFIDFFTKKLSGKFKMLNQCEPFLAPLKYRVLNRQVMQK